MAHRTHLTVPGDSFLATHTMYGFLTQTQNINFFQIIFEQQNLLLPKGGFKWNPDMKKRRRQATLVPVGNRNGAQCITHSGYAHCPPLRPGLRQQQSQLRFKILTHLHLLHFTKNPPSTPLTCQSPPIVNKGCLATTWGSVLSWAGGPVLSGKGNLKETMARSLGDDSLVPGSVTLPADKGGLRLWNQRFKSWLCH